MKTLDIHELLMVRHCKKKKTSYRTLRRIYAASRALPLRYVTNGHILQELSAIIQRFELIRNWPYFLIKETDPMKNQWWGGPVKSWEETVLDAFISVITNSEVKVFNNYRKPTWFVKKYPDKKES